MEHDVSRPGSSPVFVYQPKRVTLARQRAQPDYYTPTIAVTKTKQQTTNNEGKDEEIGQAASTEPIEVIEKRDDETNDERQQGASRYRRTTKSSSVESRPDLRIGFQSRSQQQAPRDRSTTTTTTTTTTVTSKLRIKSISRSKFTQSHQWRRHEQNKNTRIESRKRGGRGRQLQCGAKKQRSKEGEVGDGEVMEVEEEEAAREGLKNKTHVEEVESEKPIVEVEEVETGEKSLQAKEMGPNQPACVDFCIVSSSASNTLTIPVPHNPMLLDSSKQHDGGMNALRLLHSVPYLDFDDEYCRSAYTAVLNHVPIRDQLIETFIAHRSANLSCSSSSTAVHNLGTVWMNSPLSASLADPHQYGSEDATNLLAAAVKSRFRASRDQQQQIQSGDWLVFCMAYYIDNSDTSQRPRRQRRSASNTSEAVQEVHYFSGVFEMRKLQPESDTKIIVSLAADLFDPQLNAVHQSANLGLWQEALRAVQGVDGMHLSEAIAKCSSISKSPSSVPTTPTSTPTSCTVRLEQSHLGMQHPVVACQCDSNQRDFFCQTWTLHYLYYRIHHRTTHQQVIGFYHSIPTSQRLRFIENFANTLRHFPFFELAFRQQEGDGEAVLYGGAHN